VNDTRPFLLYVLNNAVHESVSQLSISKMSRNSFYTICYFVYLKDPFKNTRDKILLKNLRKN